MTDDELAAIRERVNKTDKDYGNRLTMAERDRRELYLYVMELLGAPNAHGLDWYDWRIEFVESNVKEP